MFSFLEHEGFLDMPFRDIVLHQCRFGRSYKKPTTFRCFGAFCPKQIELTCKWHKEKATNTCGLSAHERLEFGGCLTRASQAYPDALCFAYAASLAEYRTSFSAQDRVSLHAEGKVKRHTDRGDSQRSEKERRQEEDRMCKAGARNAFDIMSAQPTYCKHMMEILADINDTVEANTEFQRLQGALGATPSRSPPPEADLQRLRANVSRTLGMTVDPDWHHEASPLRAALFDHIGQKVDDADQEIAEWLTWGAPMGINREIIPGNLLPVIHETATLDVSEVVSSSPFLHNHESFNREENHEESLAELSKLVDQGFAILFAHKEAAEQYLGQQESDEHFDLHAVDLEFPPPRPDLKAFRIEFDASLWGGGGVLFEDDVPTEFMAFRWTSSDFWPGATIQIGAESPGAMVFFEYLTSWPWWSFHSFSTAFEGPRANA